MTNKEIGQKNGPDTKKSKKRGVDTPPFPPRQTKKRFRFQIWASLAAATSRDNKTWNFIYFFFRPRRKSKEVLCCSSIFFCGADFAKRNDWREGSSKLNRQKKEEENYAAPRSRKETPRRNWDTSPDFPGFFKKKNKNTIFLFSPSF